MSRSFVGSHASHGGLHGRSSTRIARAKGILKNFARKTGALTVTLSMVASMLAPVHVLADEPGSGGEQDVKVSVAATPKVDIAFAQGLTTNDGILNSLDNDETKFAKEVKKYIDSYGKYDTSGLNFIEAPAVEAMDMNTFPWLKDQYNTSIGTITASANNVNMKGNRSLAGKNLYYLMDVPKGYRQKFTFGYTLDFGDSFNSAGMMLKIEDKGDGYLYGYIVSLNYKGIDGSNGSGTNGNIWKVKWQKNTSTSQYFAQVQKVSDLRINKTGSLTVDSNSAGITVSGDAASGLTTPVTVRTDKSWANGSGFGFYSDHYSHSCDNIGNFDLRGINLNQSKSLSISTILASPQWTDGSSHVLVSLNDYKDDDFDNPSTVTSMQQRMQSDSIHFIGWGTSTGTDANKNQLEDFIAKNDGRGTFVDTKYSSYDTPSTSYQITNDYQQSVKKIGDYIIDHFLKTEETDAEVFTNDESIRLLVEPEELAQNATAEGYESGCWKIVHDGSAYKNSMGEYELSGAWQPNLSLSFDKVGKYDIYFKQALVKTLFIHRKPTASFSLLVDRDAGTVALNSNSYDLDSDDNTKNLGPGISEEKWEWKKASDSDWNSGKLETIDTSEKYMVRLTVKDYQGTYEDDQGNTQVGTWSDPVVKTIDPQSEQPPTAAYSLASSQITKYQELSITDNSFDPAGLMLSKWTWTLKKIASDGTETTVKTITKTSDDDSVLPDGNYVEYGAGKYRWDLVVTNSAATPKESTPYGREFTVTNDVTPPVVTKDEQKANEDNLVDVDITAVDPGYPHYAGGVTKCALLTQEQYDALSGDNKKPAADAENIWVDAIDGISGHVSATFEGKVAGTYYAYAMDEDGNVSDSHMVIVEEKKPAITIDPESRPEAKVDESNTNVDVKVTLGANTIGVKAFKYAVDKNEDAPAEDDPSWTNSDGMEQELSIEDTGKWYVHVSYAGLNGTKETKVGGLYYIDKDNPVVDGTKTVLVSNAFQTTIEAHDEFGKVSGFALAPEGTDPATLEFKAPEKGTGAVDDHASSTFTIGEVGDYTIFVRDDSGNVTPSGTISVRGIADPEYVITPARQPTYVGEPIDVSILVKDNATTTGDNLYALDKLYYLVDNSEEEVRGITTQASALSTQEDGESTGNGSEGSAGGSEGTGNGSEGTGNGSEGSAEDGEGSETEPIIPDPPSEAWKALTPTNGEYKLTIDGTGTWYLHLLGYFNNGAELADTAGEYLIDQDAPNVDAVDVTYENNGATIAVSASDAHSGVASYAISKVDGTDLKTASESDGASSLDWQRSNVFYVAEAGSYNVYAQDEVGNVSEAHTVKVDGIHAPKISVTPESREGSTDPVVAEVSVSDEVDHEVTWRYVVDASAAAYKSESDAGAWSEPCPDGKGSVTISEPGTWFLHVLATDVDGNVAWATFGPYVVKPVVPTPEPNPNPVINNTTTTIKADRTAVFVNESKSIPATGDSNVPNVVLLGLAILGSAATIWGVSVRRRHS